MKVSSLCLNKQKGDVVHMNESEILRHINDGANHYISLFGEAEHMERSDTGLYSIIRPKSGEEGISFIYNIRVDALDSSQLHIVVNEIRALGIPFWLDLTASDEVFKLFFGKGKSHKQTEFAPDDEQYLAMFPSEFTRYAVSHHIVEVRSPEDFAVWAKLANELLAGGHQDIHPVHHFNLIRRRLMRCYILYVDATPVSVAATMDNCGIVSLELVGTLPAYRRRGYARAVCARAIHDAIGDHCLLLTVRANSTASASVYQSLGFKVYNDVL